MREGRRCFAANPAVRICVSRRVDASDAVAGATCLALTVHGSQAVLYQLRHPGSYA